MFDDHLYDRLCGRYRLIAHTEGLKSIAQYKTGYIRIHIKIAQWNFFSNAGTIPIRTRNKIKVQYGT